MKAFERWVMGPASDDWIQDEFTGAEAAWRAALEWASQQLTNHGEIDAWDFVEQELEENDYEKQGD